MRLSTALKLGRVSNLPTVWTNCLAGAVLAGTAPASGILSPQSFGIDVILLLVILAMTFSYIGGMFLNDAFDADIDREERPERPIPSGETSRREVFIWGGALLLLSVALLSLAGLHGTLENPWLPALTGLILAGLIVLYNSWHKNNPLSPLIMGLCRVCVYLVAAVTFASVPPAIVFIGSALLLSYLIGLTFVAKQENLGHLRSSWPLLFLGTPVIFGLLLLLTESPAAWPFWAALLCWILFCLWLLKRRSKGDIPRAVVSLIAGISLLDALLIASSGQFGLALVCVCGFLLTLAFQRFIAGT